MLTIPVKARRRKQPYLAIRAKLQRRLFGKQSQLFLSEVLAHIVAHNVENYGPAFYRYISLDSDGELEAEFGYFTERVATGSWPIRSGTLPAGSYVATDWWGDYERLPEVQRLLDGWVSENDLVVDVTETGGKTEFGCRMEIFHVAPPIEQLPENWKTEVAILLQSGRRGKGK